VNCCFSFPSGFSVARGQLWSLRVALVFFFSAAVAWARLGENEPELVRRYGPMTLREPEIVIEEGKMQTLADCLHFRKDEWTIIARLVEGRCESITIVRDGDWSDDEFQRVLAANRGNSTWKELKSSTPKQHRSWKRRDGGSAEWGLMQGMTLETPAYAKARETVRQRAKKTAAK
jgi:hypothetical protein